MSKWIRAKDKFPECTEAIGKYLFSKPVLASIKRKDGSCLIGIVEFAKAVEGSCEDVAIDWINAGCRGDDLEEGDIIEAWQELPSPYCE